jgi:ABC-type dipeptide/oligopeptide/nickel transport system permease subunit
MIGKSKINIVAVGIIVVLYLIAITAPYISPYDPLKLGTSNILAPPDGTHLLGTDAVGRDLFSRVLYGTRISMTAGLVVVALIVMIGLPIGSVAGYFGGRLDDLLMRSSDVLMAFPSLILAILFAYVIGRGVVGATIAISLVEWTTIARLVRGAVLLEKEKEYVMAARAVGKGDMSILFGEVLPNAIYPVVTTAMLLIGAAIIELAGLSFLGVGTQPPTPDLGVMVSEGRQYLISQPLISVVPGVVIIIAVLTFNLIGDALRDAMDPRLRRL